MSALPIYFENYNIVFYENKDQNLLIIPCFLSLFTEYLILPHLKLEISGIFSEFFDFQANFEVIAYNSFSENSIIVHVQTNNEVNGESFPLLILLMSICCLVIFVGAFGLLWIFISRKVMKERTQKSIEKEEELRKMGFIRVDANLMVFLKRERKKKE